MTSRRNYKIPRYGISVDAKLRHCDNVIAQMSSSMSGVKMRMKYSLGTFHDQDVIAFTNNLSSLLGFQ